jgi:heme-degrading monooxygenase HmoA
VIESKARVDSAKGFLLMHDPYRGIVSFKDEPNLSLRNQHGVCVVQHRINFDERAVRKIAETARVRFEGMPGLRSKAFTLNSGKREAANFYVWDSEDAAKAFFTDELVERVASLYGVRPSVEFVQIATLVENSRP